MEMVRYRYFNHSFTDSVIYVVLYLKGGGRPKGGGITGRPSDETRYFRYYRNSITGKIKDEYSYKVFFGNLSKRRLANTPPYTFLPMGCTTRLTWRQFQRGWKM